MTAADCGTRIPLDKCRLASTAPSQIGTTEPVPVDRSASAAEIGCDRDFFDPSDSAALKKHLGETQCFRFAHSSQWILIASDVLTSGAAAPGGGLVATYTCPRALASCLDASAKHALSEFTAFYPPDPSNGTEPVKLMASADSKFLQILVSSCSIATEINVGDGLWLRQATIPALEDPHSALSVIQNVMGQLELDMGSRLEGPGRSQLAVLLSAMSSQKARLNGRALLSRLDAAGSPLPASDRALLEQLSRDSAALPRDEQALNSPPPVSLAVAVAQPAPPNTGSCR